MYVITIKKKKETTTITINDNVKRNGIISLSFRHKHWKKFTFYWVARAPISYKIWKLNELLFVCLFEHQNENEWRTIWSMNNNKHTVFLVAYFAFQVHWKYVPCVMENAKILNGEWRKFKRCDLALKKYWNCKMFKMPMLNMISLTNFTICNLHVSWFSIAMFSIRVPLFSFSNDKFAFESTFSSEIWNNHDISCAECLNSK